jgi:hypothetical protein
MVRLADTLNWNSCLVDWTVSPQRSRLTFMGLMDKLWSQDDKIPNDIVAAKCLLIKFHK